MYFASALTWGAVQNDQDVLVPHELRIPTVYRHALIGSINNLGTDLKVPSSVISRMEDCPSDSPQKVRSETSQCVCKE